MTKIIKYSLIAFVVFLATGCMTACDESHTSDGGEGTPPTLSKPSGIKVDFWEFSWSSVDNATGYVVELSGEEYLTQDSSFSLFDYVAPEEECILKVKAVGDGISFSDSEWAMTKYTAEKVTADLTYTLLENDTYSVFCPIDNIPSNGELVLPDYHQGKLVTVFEAEPGYPQSEYSEIFKVRFPVKLKEIGEGALYRSSISEIYLPSSVKSI